MSHQATKYGSTGGYETSTSKSSTLYGEGLLEDEETLVTSNSDSDDPPFEPRKKSAAKKGSVWSKVFIALVVISFFYFLNQKYEFLKPHNDINKNEKSDSSTVAPDTATKPVPAPARDSETRSADCQDCRRSNSAWRRSSAPVCGRKISSAKAAR